MDKHLYKFGHHEFNVLKVNITLVLTMRSFGLHLILFSSLFKLVWLLVSKFSVFEFFKEIKNLTFKRGYEIILEDAVATVFQNDTMDLKFTLKKTASKEQLLDTEFIVIKPLNTVFVSIWVLLKRRFHI